MPALNADDRLQAFFDLCPDLACIRDRDGYFQELNGVWEQVSGWSLPELRSRSWWDFIHPDDVEMTWELEQQSAEHPPRCPLQYKHRFLCKNGSYRWLTWRWSPPREGICLGIARDVTERQWRGSSDYRNTVREAVKLRDRAIEASTVGIVIADATLPDMPLIYVNPAFERITGYSAAEVLGTNCRFLQGEENQQPVLDDLRAAIKAGESCTVILRNYRKDGKFFWNELAISPIYDDRGILTHFVGVQSDVSDRIQAEQALRREKHKSDRLLLNILPETIAEQLKEARGTLAEQYSNTAILFADLVGFTPFSAQMQPLELVSILNDIFSRFDRLAEKHGVEKIKTIGDAYLAAGGLPIPREDSLEAIANMALEMPDEIQKFNDSTGQNLQLRIGIETGVVVAGVIGIKKFIYDLWGDTVNTASRMESQGQPGKIQVTERVARLLPKKYILERRGIISIKGKGRMTTYWLIGSQ
ncbi:MAG: PAS domain S-box protein [Cyanobacteria bacterium SBLK]|nr:PAS domain S-box protein [Cyanobacteria bacterium SBLK]